MLFNSWQFAVFLPIVFALYWSLPHKFRWTLILIASYWFYMSWNVKYVVLILFTTVISYISAILIERYRKHAKPIMIMALVACLGVLFVFKYFNFVSQSVTDFLHMFAIPVHPVTLKLMLPVGISFYTFQTLGYVIDVYRGETRAEHHFGIYAAFISFFPQLVAGPIERTNNLLPQIREYHEFDYSKAVYGLKLMAWGFYKKLVIADVLAVYVDKVFNDVYSYKGFALLLTSFFFALQIYCDFSGYSDIARGCSKLFGIELMQNFRSPYFASSIREFWSRWHISLSTWFRDYVYIPLGGNRCSKFRHYMNLMITFMISGLWHGANWTFVIWGVVHGLAQVFENILGVKRECRGIVRGVRVCIVFTFCVMAWILFRANNITEAFYIFSHVFSGITKPVLYLGMGGRNAGVLRSGIISISITVFVLFIYDYISMRKNCEALANMHIRSKFIRWTVYMLLGLAVLFLSPKGVATEFVYFQF